MNIQLNALLIFSFSILMLDSVNADSQLYYETKLTMKVALEDNPTPSSTKISYQTHTHKTLINLVNDLPPTSKLDKNKVLALRLDDCETGTTQLVVYDKLAKTELKNVSNPFSLFTTQVKKSKNGIKSEARFYATGEFLDSGGTDYSVNSGGFVIAGSAKFTADGCPSSVNGSFIGAVNITFQDDIGNGPFPETKDALILNGSSLSAKRIVPTSSTSQGIKSGTWTGNTSQQMSFSLIVNGTDKTITQNDFEWVASGCGSNGTVSTTFQNLSMNAKGAFSSGTFGSGCPYVTMTGILNNNGTANGTLKLQFASFNCGCTGSMDMNWSATAP